MIMGGGPPVIMDAATVREGAEESARSEPSRYGKIIRPAHAL